ncbi:MAG TPA: glycosyltransferase [Blastocatellia bacterium]
MQKTDLVSVIIPCYNQAHFLREALESVIGQTYPHYEVIVVDDGSTDDTQKVSSTFERVRCLKQKNRGLAAARNAGFEASRGSLVVFLDADDRLLPAALEDGINSLDSHPACAFAYGHVRLIASDGSPVPTPHQVAIESDHYLELLRHNIIWTTGAIVYRREALDEVGGFNPLVSGSADFDLNARISRLFPICCSERIVLEYRHHDDSMSRDFALMLKAAVTARRLQWKFVRGSKPHQEALRTGIRAAQEDYGEKLIRQMRDRLRRGEWSGAMSGLLTLLRYYPQGIRRHAFQKLHQLVFDA